MKRPYGTHCEFVLNSSRPEMEIFRKINVEIQGKLNYSKHSTY